MAQSTRSLGVGLRLDVPGEELIVGLECRGLCNDLPELGVGARASDAHPVVHALFSSQRSVTARDAHSAEDWRRHAWFMAKPSKEPSRTERARVALACVWMQLLKLRKTATSQGCKYDVLRGGMKHSTM